MAKTFAWNPEDHEKQFGIRYALGIDLSTPVPQSLEGQVGIVTGGGGSVGAAVSWELARRGMTVVVSDVGTYPIPGSKPGSTAKRVADAIVAAGFKAEPDSRSVSDPLSAGSIVLNTVARHGQLDLLITPAGFVDDAPFQNQTWERFQRLYNVHVGGTVNMLLPAYQHFLDRGKGTFIGVPSSAGICGNGAQAGYAMAKAAILGLVSTLADELNVRRKKGDHEISVHAVSPVAFSPMTEPFYKGRDMQALDPFGLAGAAAQVYTALAIAGTPLNGQVFALRTGDIYLLNGAIPHCILPCNDEVLSAEQIAEAFPRMLPYARTVGLAGMRAFGPFEKHIPRI